MILLRPLLLLFLLVVGPLSLPAEALSDPDPARFEKQIEGFRQWDAAHQAPPETIVFVGSSTIHGWQTAEAFPDLPVLNRGFGGAHISDVLAFWDDVVLRHRPATVVFYCGDNDIAGQKAPERVLGDFQRFMERIRVALPGTRVIYLPIKPSLKRWGLWPQMETVNEHIRSLAAESSDLSYADTATPMLGSDQRPRPELFRSDGLHLNAEGYALWTKIVEPFLRTGQD